MKTSLLLWLGLVLGAEAWATELKTIEVVAGNLREIHVPESYQVVVEKKNIVEAEWKGGSHWVLVGKHWGIAVVSFLGEGGAVVAKLVVRVISQKQASLGKRNVGGLEALCKASQLKCVGSGPMISGEARDSVRFFRMRQMCMASPSCDFQGKLSRRSLNDIKREAQGRLDGDHQISQGLEGRLLLEWPCYGEPPEWLKHRVKGYFADLVKYDGLGVVCEGRHSKVRLLIDVFYLLKSEAEGLGLLWSRDNLNPFSRSPGLKNFLSQNSQRILGSGDVTARSPGKVTWRSGSEIRMQGRSDDAREFWYAVGLSLDLELKGMSDRGVDIGFNLKLTAPKSGGDSLESSVIKSETRVETNRDVVVGSYGARFKGQGITDQPLWAGVPIIGPWFKVKEKAQQDVAVFLMLNVKKL